MAFFVNAFDKILDAWTINTLIYAFFHHLCIFFTHFFISLAVVAVRNISKYFFSFSSSMRNTCLKEKLKSVFCWITFFCNYNRFCRLSELYLPIPNQKAQLLCAISTNNSNNDRCHGLCLATSVGFYLSLRNFIIRLKGKRQWLPTIRKISNQYGNCECWKDLLRSNQTTKKILGKEYRDWF